jgi:hypothetical protein
MKNKFPSYRMFSSIGLLLILSTMSSNIFWVRFIFGSLGVLLELVSLILIVKELCNKNKSSQESVLFWGKKDCRVVAIIATICAIGFGIATAITGSEWCGAAAATCALVAAWCGIAPSL